jgi:hypothetical protein
LITRLDAHRLQDAPFSGVLHPVLTFLRESGFRRPEQRAEKDQGWTSESAELVAYLEGESA